MMVQVLLLLVVMGTLMLLSQGKLSLRSAIELHSTTQKKVDTWPPITQFISGELIEP